MRADRLQTLRTDPQRFGKKLTKSCRKLKAADHQALQSWFGWAVGTQIIFAKIPPAQIFSRRQYLSRVGQVKLGRYKASMGLGAKKGCSPRGVGNGVVSVPENW